MAKAGSTLSGDVQSGDAVLAAAYKTDHATTVMPRRAVEIHDPETPRGSWAVRLIEPFSGRCVESYLAAGLDPALRVARLLLSGQPVPNDYRRWR